MKNLNKFQGTEQVYGENALFALANERMKVKRIVSDYEIAFALEIIEKRPDELTSEDITMISEFAEKQREILHLPSHKDPKFQIDELE
jgi:hypothetical protein